MTDMRGKNVLITGAANGIGRRLARKAAAEHAHVILWDSDGQALRELTQELRSAGRDVSSSLCDVSDREAVYARAERVMEQHGPVDVLVNNAGIVTGKPILEASDEEIQQTFEVNVLAHFWTVRAFLPAMARWNSGHIVTVASAGGLVAAPKLTDYSASKFAAVGLDEALRLELKRQGLAIKTTLVCPYYVNTGMFEGVKTRFSWLLPVLDADYVADKIVDAIRKNRWRVILPRFVYLTPLMRVLPVNWFDGLVGFFGVSRSMDDFSGRLLEGQSEVEGAESSDK